jgi:hypothetical protein
MESEPGSSFLFRRVFFTRTGIHFARKRSKTRQIGFELKNAAVKRRVFCD